MISYASANFLRHAGDWRRPTDGRLGEWRARLSVLYAFLESHLLCWPLTMLRATGTEWTLEEVATVVHLVSKKPKDLDMRVSAKPTVEEVDRHPPVLAFVENLLSNYEDHFTSFPLCLYLLICFTWRPDRLESFLLLRNSRKMRAKWSCYAQYSSCFFGGLQRCLVRCLPAIQAQEVSKMDPRKKATI